MCLSSYNAKKKAAFGTLGLLSGLFKMKKISVANFFVLELEQVTAIFRQLWENIHIYPAKLCLDMGDFLSFIFYFVLKPINIAIQVRIYCITSKSFIERTYFVIHIIVIIIQHFKWRPITFLTCNDKNMFSFPPFLSFQLLLSNWLLYSDDV